MKRTRIQDAAAVVVKTENGLVQRETDDLHTVVAVEQLTWDLSYI